MATSSRGSVLQHLRCTLRWHEGGPPDAVLLRQFIEHRDEAAFATIVRRNGPMVMAVCRRLLHDQHDAEDAFQATFLILVRKAASITKRELLANWLYGVSHKTALKARAITMRRRAKEKQVAEMPEPATGEPAVACEELLALLDQELSRLPERYRIPIILCDLEGKTRRQAAAALDCPEGSLSSRLARGRVMLAKRLTRHGVAVSTGAIAAVLAQQASSASVPSGILASTIRVSVLLAAGDAAVSAMPPKVTTLMEGVMKAMLLSKLRAGAFWVLLGLFAFGTCLALFPGAIAQTRPAGLAGGSTQPSPPEGGKQAEAHPEDELKKDADALQGKWSIELGVIGGNVVPADIIKAVVVEFKGDKVTHKPDIGVDARQPGKVTFSLYDNPNPTQFKLRGPNPKQMELTLMDPDEKRKPSSTCSYRLKGDTLVLFDGQGGKDMTPVDITPQGLRQNIMALRRLPKMGADQKEGKEPSTPVEKAPGVEKNAKAHEALQQYGKEEGAKRRGPRFFVLAMLLNPAAYDLPPTISEEVALTLLGDPDFEYELGIRQADGKVVDRAVSYIYVVDNSKGQTIPKEWKVAASEKIQVSLTIRDGSVVSTGWNAYSGKEEYPAYRKGKKP
jgi:RNA polymerase sigma factor (sigma-70 family)